MTEDLATPSGDRFEHSLIVNPGVRFAIDATPLPLRMADSIVPYHLDDPRLGVHP